MPETTEIPKAYEPAAVEEKWQARWLADGVFTADAKSEKPAFSIVIPPPNVTGVLHLGHVLNNTIQDVLARRARMRGCEVLWLPGCDHAGIATQTRVEKMLRAEGTTRHELGREAFTAKVWEWKEKHGGIIIEQLKRLGCSCDWSRERFTMDADYSRQVQEVFVDLYKKGRIYRGKRMVNWCPASLTALSDEEVIMRPTQGTLYYMRYEVAERPGTFLEIATTRPETLMGDTAVAVNPKDPRYQELIGLHCWRPFPRVQIPIVGDERIDIEFGTGVLKVTPAHDKADFEIGQRHGLESIDVLNPDGTLNALAGPEFEGMDRFVARKAAAEKLRELGLLVREEPYSNNVGYSERANVPIEPRLSEQWFLKYPKLDEALAAVRDGTIGFTPERWVKVYEHWLENNVDWCLSRQLWWGHRLPVWYNKRGEARLDETVPVIEVDPFVLLGASVRETRRKAWEFVEEKGWLNRVFPNEDTGLGFEVRSSSLEHAFSNWGIENILAVSALPELIRSALLVSETAHEPPVPQIRRVFTLLSAMRIEEELYRVKITVKEHLDGTRLYDHHVQKVSAPDGKSPKSHPANGKLEPGPAPSAQTDVRPLGQAVNKEMESGGDKSPEEAGPAASFALRPTSDSSVTVGQLCGGVNWDDRLTRIQIECPGPGWAQDPDVLDTWFSSWLWPFATMDEATRAKFYPTTVLVTSWDIIFLWVARMVMAGYEFTGQAPFGDVFFNSLILDAEGRKMSKSLGNSPDPLDLIGKYGADGLRFGLLRIAPHGQDVRFDEKQIEEGRNFANKLWNAARFRQMHGPSDPDARLAGELSIFSKDILAKLDDALAKIDAACAGYRVNEITQLLYDFFWSDYCDWYVEAAKEEIFSDDPARKSSALAVMDHVLSRLLRLLHPFMPHLTAELWERIGFTVEGESRIVLAPFPQPSGSQPDTEAQARVAAVYRAVHAARNLRAESRVPSNKKVRFILRAEAGWIAEELGTFARLVNAEEIVLDAAYEAEPGVPRVLTELGELYLPLAGLVDVAAERERLEKEIAKAELELVTVRRKLANSSFVANAPATVVEEHRQREMSWHDRLEQLRTMLAALGA